MNCEQCGNAKITISIPDGRRAEERCLRCTPTTIQLPKNTLKAKRKSQVFEHYDQMPLIGENDGDTYYITSMNAVCRWDAAKKDYQTLDLDMFEWSKPEDKFNDRRGAIRAQKARKNRG